MVQELCLSPTYLTDTRSILVSTLSLTKQSMDWPTSWRSSLSAYRRGSAWTTTREARERTSFVKFSLGRNLHSLRDIYFRFSTAILPLSNMENLSICYNGCLQHYLYPIWRISQYATMDGNTLIEPMEILHMSVCYNW